MLLDLKKAGKISDSTYKMLYSSDGLCPRFYGLPKIHKPGIPLRPIVSFVNSPTYAISGYLARILSPVVGNTDYTVKNSCEFADFIRDKTLNACEELVSFDVVSFFTKIPVDLAVKVAGKISAQPHTTLCIQFLTRENNGKNNTFPLRKQICFTIVWGCAELYLFICCLFASKPRYLHITAPTINTFLVQLWVRLSLLSLPTW